MTGDLVARIRADGLEFADTRAFVPGDRLRSVNWRASARRGELIVNERHPDRNADVVLFLDSFAEARSGDEGADGTLERAVRAAATLASRHLARRDRVGLVTFGGILRWLEPGFGLVQRYRLIDALLETGVEFSYAWKDVNVIPARTLPPKALVLAVTPLLDERSIAALLDLAARGHDLVVIEVSPEELVAPGPGLDALAFRLWVLQRAALRSRFERSGVAVARWSEERATRFGPGGGEGISASRKAVAAVILGAGSAALAAGLTLWLASGAGTTAERPVASLGTAGAALLVVTLAVRRAEGIAVALLLLGAAYATTLVLDDPPLDARSAIVGAALVAAGELAHLSLGARSAVTEEAGTIAHRVAWVAVLALGAMALGGIVLAAVDLLRTGGGGVAIEVVGVATALVAVGILVLAARETRASG